MLLICQSMPSSPRYLKHSLFLACFLLFHVYAFSEHRLQPLIIISFWFFYLVVWRLGIEIQQPLGFFLLLFLSADVFLQLCTRNFYCFYKIDKIFFINCPTCYSYTLAQNDFLSELQLKLRIFSYLVVNELFPSLLGLINALSSMMAIFDAGLAFSHSFLTNYSLSEDFVVEAILEEVELNIVWILIF